MPPRVHWLARRQTARDTEPDAPTAEADALPNPHLGFPCARIRSGTPRDVLRYRREGRFADFADDDVSRNAQAGGRSVGRATLCQDEFSRVNRASPLKPETVPSRHRPPHPAPPAGAQVPGRPRGSSLIRAFDALTPLG